VTNSDDTPFDDFQNPDDELDLGMFLDDTEKAEVDDDAFLDIVEVENESIDPGLAYEEPETEMIPAFSFEDLIETDDLPGEEAAEEMDSVSAVAESVAELDFPDESLLGENTVRVADDFAAAEFFESEPVAEFFQDELVEDEGLEVNEAADEEVVFAFDEGDAADEVAFVDDLSLDELSLDEMTDEMTDEMPGEMTEESVISEETDDRFADLESVFEPVEQAEIPDDPLLAVLEEVPAVEDKKAKKAREKAEKAQAIAQAKAAKVQAKADKAAAKAQAKADKATGKTQANVSEAVEKAQAMPDKAAAKAQAKADKAAAKAQAKTDKAAAKTQAKADKATAKAQAKADKTAEKTQAMPDETAEKAQAMPDKAAAKAQAKADKAAAKAQAKSEKVKKEKAPQAEKPQKVEKPPKAKKEKKPKEPGEKQPQNVAALAFMGSLVLMLLAFGGVNAYALMKHGIGGALVFLLFFDVLAAGALVIPILLRRSKNTVTASEVSLGIAAMSLIVGCMFVLANLAYNLN